MKRKMFAKVLALATVMSVIAAPMTAMASTSAGGSVNGTITAYTTGSKYVETHATDNDTINSPSASTNITSVTVTTDDGKTETYTADTINGTQGVLTLVVNEQQEDIIDYIDGKTKLKAGTYSFETTAGTVEHKEFAKFMNMAGNDAQYTFRQALKVENGKINDNETIPSLLTNVKYSATGMSDGSLVSNGAFFNGVTVDSSPFIINKVNFEALGDGANDFQGEAAVILAQGSANVSLNNSYIHTAGVIRTAAAAKESGVLNIDDSVIYTEEGTDTDAEYDALVVPMMKRTPFALGIEGTVRATNILGAGQGKYTDSLIVSSGWGVLSTDSGEAYSNTGTYALDVSNVVAGIGSVSVMSAAENEANYDAVKTVNGVKYGFKQTGSGYVAYADSGVYDKFDNVKFYSDDYVQIMASQQSSAYYTNSTLDSGRIAIMTQQNNGGTISIKDSKVEAEDTVVQIKSGAANEGYTNVVFDNADIDLGDDHNYGGTLVELVESDDAGNPGNTTYTIDDQGNNAKYTNTTIADSNATLKNGSYDGNIWNNIYNKREALNVTLDAATLTGTISSSYGTHMDQNNKTVANGTVLEGYTHGDYRKGNLTDYRVIGAQYNTASAQVNNAVNVTLKNNSTWNLDLADGTEGIADAMYINDLTVESGSAIKASKPVTIYVYGTQDIKGSVDSNITIKTAEVDKSGAEADGVVKDTQFYSGTPIQFIAQDESGNPIGTDIVTVDGQAFTTYGFNVTVASGYTFTMKANYGKIVTGNDNGYTYTYTEDQSAGGKTHIVTITVKKSSSSKKAQTIKLNTTKKTLKYKNLKKKTVSFNLKATAKGALTFKQVSSGSKKISVNKSGKVTVKKGLKKGNYNLKVKISAKATSKYKASSVTKTIKIAVK